MGTPGQDEPNKTEIGPGHHMKGAHECLALPYPAGGGCCYLGRLRLCALTPLAENSHVLAWQLGQQPLSQIGVLGS